MLQQRRTLKLNNRWKVTKDHIQYCPIYSKHVNASDKQVKTDAKQVLPEAAEKANNGDDG